VQWREQLEQVNSQEELVKFIEQLQADLQAHPGEWQNVTLATYLDAVAAWAQAIKPEVFEGSIWKVIARVLYSGKIYE
jgi:cytochrome c-type biogenesis protein CcmH/NrfG